MRELFNRLNDREKRIVLWLSVLLGAVLIAFFWLSLKERGAYSRRVNNVQAGRKDCERLRLLTDTEARIWSRWEATRKDLEETKAKYLYGGDKRIQELRLDLQQLFQETGIRSPQVAYEYFDFPKERVRKVHVSFSFSGSYFLLKRFLHAVEQFPKFVFVERIDFLDVNSRSGRIELKIILAGYYER